MSRGGTLLLLSGAFLLAGGLYFLIGRDAEAQPGGRQLPGETPRSGLTEVAVVKPVVISKPVVASPKAAAKSADPLIEANNLGAELLGAGDLLAALEKFEQCVQARPENEIFRANLGEVLLRLALKRHAAHELSEAIDLLERAIAQVPDREGLQPLLARWRDEAEVEFDHWTESSDLLVLSYDVKRPDLLDNSRLVMDHLERAYGELQLWFGVDPVRELGVNKIRVVLYGDEEFDRLTGLGDWAGGVFDGVVRIAVGNLLTEQLRWRRTMTHELVHAYIYALGGNQVPGWLNEGLAQLLESEQPDLETARRRLGSTRFPLAKLKNSLATWTDRTKISKAYAQSLLLVSLIRHDYGEEVLRRMIIACKSGTDPAVSFEAYTSVSLESVLEFLR